MRRESFDTPLHALKNHAQASGSIRARSITVQVAKEFDSCYVWENSELFHAPTSKHIHNAYILQCDDNAYNRGIMLLILEMEADRD